MAREFFRRIIVCKFSFRDRVWSSIIYLLKLNGVNGRKAVTDAKLSVKKCKFVLS